MGDSGERHGQSSREMMRTIGSNTRQYRTQLIHFETFIPIRINKGKTCLLRGNQEALLNCVPEFLLCRVKSTVRSVGICDGGGGGAQPGASHPRYTASPGPGSTPHTAPLLLHPTLHSQHFIFINFNIINITYININNNTNITNINTITIINNIINNTITIITNITNRSSRDNLCPEDSPPEEGLLYLLVDVGRNFLLLLLSPLCPL